MTIKQLLEYQEVCLNDNCKKTLQKFIESKKSLCEVFAFTSKGIKAKQYVGVLKFKNYQFEILPKLLNKDNLSETEKQITLKNLLYMLSLTKKLDIKETEISKICKCKNPFLEILIKIYAQSLFECLKRYIPKNYIIEQNNLNFLKGKLLFSKHILKNYTNKAKFYCQYDEFSENNLLNQLFYYVSHLLYLISSDIDNKRNLKFVTDFFCDIDFKKINQVKIKNLKLNKSQAIFTKPFNLAKMFLENSSIDISQNKISSIALLWDMNKLFEEFIFEFIKKHIKTIDRAPIKITSQKHSHLLTHTKNKKPSGNTYVDILLQYGENKIILDTKYKINDGSIGNFANADIFQMLAYETLHKTNKSILLYPININIDKEINTYKFNETANYITTATIYLGYDSINEFNINLSKKLKTIIKYSLNSNTIHK
ncbi:McrC family protein [Elusimicrobiota bacterium]|jgi:5-methylcytosine-specific restriction enzyme subunit McrC